MMATAELGLYNTSGPSLAIAVLITLLAGLTLTPAMLRVLGHHAFWPRKAHRMKEAGIWSAWAAKVVKRPWVAFLIPVIVLVPLAWYGSGLGRDFDLLADLPKDNETAVGLRRSGRALRRGTDAATQRRGSQPRRRRHAGRIDSSAGPRDKAGHPPPRGDVRSFSGSLPDKKTLNVTDQLATVKKSVDDGAMTIDQYLPAPPGPRPATAAPGRRRFRQPPSRRLAVEGRRRIPGADRRGLPRRHPEQRLRTGHRRALAVGDARPAVLGRVIGSSGTTSVNAAGRAGLGPAQGHLPRARHAAGAISPPSSRTRSFFPTSTCRATKA